MASTETGLQESVGDKNKTSDAKLIEGTEGPANELSIELGKVKNGIENVYAQTELPNDPINW